MWHLGRKCKNVSKTVAQKLIFRAVSGIRPKTTYVLTCDDVDPLAADDDPNPAAAADDACAAAVAAAAAASICMAEL